jgi:hypothetical protein
MFGWFFKLFPKEDDPRCCGAARSSGWPKAREEHLKSHSTCLACGGTEELEVHHRLPFHLHPELELDPFNLITLCEKNHCHYVIGHLLSWKSFNKNVFEDATALREKIRERP